MASSWPLAWRLDTSFLPIRRASILDPSHTSARVGHAAAPCSSPRVSGPRDRVARTRGSPRPLMLHEERKACYEARDAYFACVLVAPGRRQTKVLRRAYEKHCPPSWVTHFDAKRAEDGKLAALLDTRGGGEKNTAATSGTTKQK